MKIITFYIDGFKSLSKLGKVLWIIILIKLAIIFLLLKIFIFNNYLSSHFDTDEQRSNHVLEELTQTSK